ncbi:MAG: hypothetical protein EBS20_10515 [Actinobacteria bacterium]|nr:hypothetical protein [Actinomycetota bacterium]
MIRFRRTWRRPGPEGVVPHLMADVARRAREVSDLDVAMWRCVAGDSADLYRLSAIARDPADIADLISAFGTDADLRNLSAEIGAGADTSDHHDHVIVAARRAPRPGTIRNDCCDRHNLCRRTTNRRHLGRRRRQRRGCWCKGRAVRHRRPRRCQH